MYSTTIYTIKYVNTMLFASKRKKVFKYLKDNLQNRLSFFAEKI